MNMTNIVFIQSLLWDHRPQQRSLLWAKDKLRHSQRNDSVFFQRLTIFGRLIAINVKGLVQIEWQRYDMNPDGIPWCARKVHEIFTRSNRLDWIKTKDLWWIFRIQLHVFLWHARSHSNFILLFLCDHRKMTRIWWAVKLNERMRKFEFLLWTIFIIVWFTSISKTKFD